MDTKQIRYRRQIERIGEGKTGNAVRLEKLSKHVNRAGVKPEGWEKWKLCGGGAAPPPEGERCGIEKIGTTMTQKNRDETRAGVKNHSKPSLEKEKNEKAETNEKAKKTNSSRNRGRRQGVA